MLNLLCRTLTKKPHIAGMDTNIELAAFVADEWKSLKFDKVEMVNFSVLLQYPNDTNPNKFQIQFENGSVYYDSPTASLEPPLTEDENQTGVPRPFNAYSGKGSATV